MRYSTALGTLAIALFVGIGVYLLPLDPSILHLQFSFGEHAFNAVLSEWQPVGTARYRAHFPADFLFLGAYGVFGFLFGRERSQALVAQPKLAAGLTWSLPVAAVADALEDMLHLALTASDPPTNPALYALSGTAASFKWFGIAAFLCCFVLYRSKRGGLTIARGVG